MSEELEGCKFSGMCPVVKWLSAVVAITLPILAGWITWTNVRLDKAEEGAVVMVQLVEKVGNMNEDFQFIKKYILTQGMSKGSK